MEIHFRRTGERRYAVTIDRKNLPVVEMNPAPGYDPLIPHDLMHLVVESELGLSRGIFGQVANGGHAGTFHVKPASDKSSREAARHRRRTSKRGARLLREGREEAEQSERATYLCRYEWLTRSSDPERRNMAIQMAGEAKRIRKLQPNPESRALNDELIARVCSRLDDLSARWVSLGIGGSVTLEWPENK